jgi:hypothetical protein
VHSDGTTPTLIGGMDRIIGQDKDVVKRFTKISQTLDLIVMFVA